LSTAGSSQASLRGFHQPAPSGLFWPLQSLTLAQAHTGAAAVFVDEILFRFHKTLF
jgi:hypothetical protein